MDTNFMPKALVLVLALLLLKPCFLVANNFASLRGHGLLAEGFSFFATEKERIDDSYFNTLDLATSEPGAVKTYAVVTSVSMLKSNSDDFNKPLLKGKISSGFGNRIHPILNKRIYHTGIDIAAPKGTPIYSSKAGKVTYSGWKTGYGYIIIIEHPDKYQTVYAHCSQLQVKVGQAINSGQQIGLVGRTGVATGAHLHFEIRKNGKPINPINFVRY